MKNFNDDLREELKDHEFVAHFANAQAESARELLRCGIVSELNETSGSNLTYHNKYPRRQPNDR